MTTPIFEFEEALKRTGAKVTLSWHNADMPGIGMAYDDVYNYMFDENSNTVRVALKDGFNSWASSTDITADLPHDWSSFRLLCGLLDGPPKDKQFDMTSMMGNIPRG